VHKDLQTRVWEGVFTFFLYIVTLVSSLPQNASPSRSVSRFVSMMGKLRHRGGSALSEIPWKPAATVSSLRVSPRLDWKCCNSLNRLRAPQAAVRGGVEGLAASPSLRSPKLPGCAAVTRRWQRRAGTGFCLAFARWKAAAFEILLIFNSLRLSWIF